MSHRIWLGLAVALACCVPAYAQVTESVTSTPALAIPDNDPVGVTDTITLVGGFTVEDANISVDITHTWIGDITCTVDHGGTVVNLFSGSGGSSDDVLAVFSSHGGPFDSADLHTAAPMQAEGPGAMSDYHGVDAAGDWIMFLSDSASGDTGTLNEWTVDCGDTHVAIPHPYDGCETALSVGDGAWPLDTTDATDEGLLAPGCGFGAVNDIFLVYTAPACPSTITVSTDDPGTMIDTTIAAYSDCPIATEVACNDDTVGLTSEISWDAAGGATYYIRIWGFNGGTGEIVANISSVATAPVLNDICADAIEAFDGTTAWSNACASQSGENPGCGSATNPYDLWYTYTATCDGDLQIDTCGSGGDTRLGVWNGTTCPALATADYCNDDSCGLQSALTISGVLSGDQFLIMVAGYSGGIVSDGLLNIACTTPAGTPVTSLECFEKDGDVALSWINPEPIVADELIVVVNGVETETLTSDSTFATATGLTPFADNDICIRARQAGYADADTCCTVPIGGNVSGLIVILDGDTGGLIDDVAGITAILDSGAIPYVVVTTLAGLSGLPVGAINASGTYPANSALSPDDGLILAGWMDAGADIAFFSGDRIGFDAPTAMNDQDGVDNDTFADGDDSFTAMVFLNEFAALGGDAYNQDATGSDWTDQLNASGTETTPDLYIDGGAVATPVVQDDDDLYFTGILFRTPAGIGNVLSCSFEMSGLAATQVDFLLTMSAQLDNDIVLGTPYVRADINADGAIDIADGIYVLDYLFNDGPDPSCLDAADTNADGGIDIGDGIFALDYLFNDGPDPSAPFPDCGILEVLGCDSYLPCAAVKK